MTDSAAQSDQSAPPAEGSAGMRLAAAREAAGLSIDAVAQQLKLAPRQVRALEEDDFAKLPGRTFIRGFARNYARLLHLDPDAVLAALPEPEMAPSLDRPSLAPTPRAMGELPADLQQKAPASRWAIPLALLAIIAIGVAYELTRPGSDLARLLGFARDRVAGPGAPTAVALPAPVVQAVPAQALPPATAPAAGTDAASPAPPADAPVATTSTAPAEVVPTAPVAAGDAPLILVFRATSWVEVKDGKGSVLLSTMGYPGASHAVGGLLPLEVVLGNAEAVQVTWRGAPFDSTPHTRQNVAKFSLK